MRQDVKEVPESQIAFRRASDFARWLVAGLILAYGIVTYDLRAPKWAIASLALFAAPLALQWSRSVLVRTYALWLAAFLVLQALLTPLLGGDFITLPPHMRSTVDVRGSELPGMPPGLRRITSDERGFRVYPRIDYAAKRGLRIFAIGGSTTEDILLDDEATWAHLLQVGIARHGKSIEVINTGVSGLRAVNHLATLKVVMQLKPDLAIFLLGVNDWNRHIKDQFEPGHDGWKFVSLRDSTLGKVINNVAVAAAQRRLTGKAWSDQVRIIDGLKGLIRTGELSLDRSVMHMFRPAEVAAAYAATLREISRQCKEGSLTCLFVTQPHAYSEVTPAELRSRFWMTPPSAKYTLDLQSMIHIASLYNDFLKSFAAREGHPLCDVTTGIEPLPHYFYDDLHFTDEGARRIADLVLPCALKALDKRQ